MSKFNIAGINIEIVSDDLFELKRLNRFLSNKTSIRDIKVEIIKASYINKPEGKMLINEDLKWLDSMNNGDEFISYICDEHSGELRIMLKLSKSLKKATIYYRQDYLDVQGLIMELLIETLIRYCIIQRGGFSMHAAAINYNEKGILFTAPSGTGKSTQAKLWQRYKQVEILNDDRPIIRRSDGQWYVYGTPWSGSELHILNKSGPLSAIIAIRQSTENSIRRLNSKEALAYVMPRCFLPYFDQQLMDTVIKHIGSVIKNTPVYLLSCKPDEEAVELVSKCLELS
jgi:hypothetical protein